MKHKWYNESWKWGGRDFICKKYEDAIHTKCASDRFNRVTRPKYVNNILFRMKARREKDSYALGYIAAVGLHKLGDDRGGVKS